MVDIENKEMYINVHNTKNTIFCIYTRLFIKYFFKLEKILKIFLQNFQSTLRRG